MLGQCGRLGNQLWQIASTIGIAARHNEQVCFPKWDYARFFSVPDGHFVSNVYGQPVQNFVPYLAPEARDYLQDYNLWAPVQNHIRAIFQPSDLVREEFTKPQYQEFFSLPGPTLSVHVRRGDNATEGAWKADYHPLRPMSYYHEAIAASKDFKSIAVFSDDIDWCKEHFAEYNPYFHEGGVPRPKEHETEYATAPVLDWIDFFLMVNCAQHIISNSTYAWWAAWLGGSASPIYPSNWFGPKLAHIDTALMFPPNWIEIKYDPV